MLRYDIDIKIIDATKQRKLDELYVLKMIKAEFLKFRTSNGFSINDFTDAREVNILQKMLKSWIEERDAFVQAGRDVEQLNARINILKSFIPPAPSDEDVADIIFHSGIEPTIKNMRTLLNLVQEKFSTATGQQVKNVIESMNKK